jgi:hypothetical protein
MKYFFTKHSKEKLVLMRKYGFLITRKKVKDTIKYPLKTESKSDGTIIASSEIDTHLLVRVVYRIENDIIIIITCYPGRRKQYEI